MSPRNRYDSLIQYYAEVFGYPDWLQLKAQIRAESNFDPQAVSPVGAKGLAQFMDATLLDCIEELQSIRPELRLPENISNITAFNPETAIMCQAFYMKKLLVMKNGEWSLALACYNWGMGNVRKAQDNMEHFPKETIKYIQNCMTFYSWHLKEVEEAKP